MAEGSQSEDLISRSSKTIKAWHVALAFLVCAMGAGLAIGARGEKYQTRKEADTARVEAVEEEKDAHSKLEAKISSVDQQTQQARIDVANLSGQISATLHTVQHVEADVHAILTGTIPPAHQQQVRHGRAKPPERSDE